MEDIKLPVKYTLFPVTDNEIKTTDKIAGYVIGKCYVLEEQVKHELDGTTIGSYSVIPCKEVRNYIKNGKIDEKGIHFVKYIFDDYDLAKEKRDKLNSNRLEKLKNSDNNNLIDKLEKMIKSMQKLKDMTEKNIEITKKLNYK